jgi:hypothetical protein
MFGLMLTGSSPALALAYAIGSSAPISAHSGLLQLRLHLRHAMMIAYDKACEHLRADISQAGKLLSQHGRAK